MDKEYEWLIVFEDADARFAYGVTLTEALDHYTILDEQPKILAVTRGRVMED